MPSLIEHNKVILDWDIVGHRVSRSKAISATGKANFQRVPYPCPDVFFSSAAEKIDVDPTEQCDSLPIKLLAWILLGFGVVLMVLSTATLISNRGAVLIEWGIYGVVRHPMYLGAMVAFLSWIFFHPHWIIVLISSVNIAIVYWFILRGERQNITKFGDAYRRYMETVPRLNLLAGLIRRLQSK